MTQTICKNCGHLIDGEGNYLFHRYNYRNDRVCRHGLYENLKACGCTNPESKEEITKNEKLIVEALCQLTKQNTKDALDLLMTLRNRPKEEV